jgi:subtilisin family serine protease
MLARRHGQAVLAFVLLALAAGAASPAAPGRPYALLSDPRGPRYVEGEILVKFRTEAPAPVRGALRLEAGAVTRHRFRSGAELWRLGPGAAVPDALARLAADPRIEYAEPNFLLHAADIPDDPLFPQQWALLNTGRDGGLAGADIDAPAAWDIPAGTDPVVVAVLDSGIDLDHPDLAPGIWANPDEIAGNAADDDGNGLVDDVHGWDFANDDDDPRDDFGHGTHVAGIIAAASDNGVGIAGIARRARLMPLKFLDAGGFGTTSDAIEAIDYAVAKGARILNASWGGGGFSTALLESIRDAGLHQALFVAAAGNDGADSDRARFLPAGYDAGNILAVAATDRTDHLARFSNFGRTTVDLAAPGVEIESTLPGGTYGLLSGTSMAAPQVAGVAALILGIAPRMEVESLRRRILDQAEPVAALSDKLATSARLNAFRCLSGADTERPGPIADLRVVEPLSDGVVLAWSAPGDDADRGTAAAYDLRVSETPFDAAGFEAAPRVPWPGPPLSAGSPETREIGGLEPSRIYYLGLRAIDAWGNAGAPGFAAASTRPPPAMDLASGPWAVALRSGEVSTGVLTLRNAGEGTLDWSVARPILRPRLARGAPTPERWGGPDDFGYVFADSDEPDGPLFAWRDISAIGHGAPITNDDPLSAPIPIGFPFPFYGQDFTDVQIAGDGFLTFTPIAASFENQPLPSTGAPGNLVAGFWDDLDLPGAQSVMWLAEPQAFTVQYNRVKRTNGGGPYTFQIVLYKDGDILFQYLEMVGLGYSETVGIQDGSGTAGLPIAFHAAYVHDGLAVRLSKPRPWVAAAPDAGRLRAGESVPVTLTFDASGLAVGTYEGRLPILANDPRLGRVEIPLTLSVGPAPAIAAEPAAVDFGSIFAKDGARLVLRIVNTGSLPLTVTTAVTDHPEVRADFAPFPIPPGGSRPVMLDWRPAEPDLLRAALRIESDAVNAPSLTVPLTGIALNMPPRALAIWPAESLECAGPDGADVVLDASTSRDDDAPPDESPGIVLYEWIDDPGNGPEEILGTAPRIATRLPIGMHRLVLRVTDNRGATDTVEKTITVADTIPPVLRVTAAPSLLWPPHHRMVPVRVTLSARDACSSGVTVRLLEASSNEPDDEPGNADGQTTGDITGAEAGTPGPAVLLRAERSDRGTGRLYTLRYVATDAAGLETSGETVITVPLRRGAHRAPNAPRK